MKNLFLTLSCAFLAITTTYAQHIDLQINPIGALFGSLSATAEFPISESIGVEPQVGLLFQNRDLLGVDYKGRGFGLGVNGKFYFGPDDGHDRFYAMGYLRYQNSNFSVDSDGGGGTDYSQNRVSLGVGLGYKWVADNGFLFELAVGGGRALLNSYDFEGEDETFERALDDLTLIDLYGRLSLGYRLIRN